MIELSPYEVALIGIGGAIAGTLIGSLVGYWLSINLSKLGDARMSAYRLHMAFRDELLMLNPQESIIEENISDFLEKSFDKHRAAVYEYSFFLKGKERNRLLNDWYNYIYHDDYKDHGVKLKHLVKYSSYGKSIDKKDESITQAKNNIERIISHAKFS